MHDMSGFTPCTSACWYHEKFTLQFGFFVHLFLFCLHTWLLYIIIIQNILRDNPAVRWHNLSALLKCKTALWTQMSKSDHISSWHGKPELYRGMIKLARLFILTVLLSVSDLHPSTADGINSDRDLDSIDYPDCEIEKIRKCLVCHDLN